MAFSLLIQDLKSPLYKDPQIHYLCLDVEEYLDYTPSASWNFRQVAACPFISPSLSSPNLLLLHFPYLSTAS